MAKGQLKTRSTGKGKTVAAEENQPPPNATPEERVEFYRTHASKVGAWSSVTLSRRDGGVAVAAKDGDFVDKLRQAVGLPPAPLNLPGLPA